MKQKLFVCQHCGNVIAMIQDCGVPVYCCGEKMQPLQPGTTEASEEKHIPVYTVEGRTVTVRVGETDHPMNPEHFIQWICLETRQGVQYRRLEPGEKPAACFALCEGDEVVAVSAFCNLHSLWKG